MHSAPFSARNVFAIVPHATNAVVPVPKRVRVNGAGTLVFKALASEADVTLNVVAGEVLDVQAKYVRATSTATGIVGML